MDRHTPSVADGVPSLSHPQAEVYQAVFEQATDGIIVSDASSRFIDVNPALCDLLAYPREELIGRRYLDLVVPEERDDVVTAIDGILAGGTSIGERRLRRKDGRVVVIEARARLLQQGYIIGIARDISKRRQAEEALRQSEELYRSLFASMSEGVAVHQIVYGEAGEPVDYRIVEVNAAYEAITGLPRDRAVGALASELYGQGEAPHLETYARVAATGEPAAFEVHNLALDQHMLVSAFSPARGQFVTAFLDITKRTRAEEALRQREAMMASIYRAAPIGVGVIRQRVIQDVNDRYCEMTGYSREEAIGQSARMVYPTDEEFEYVGREKYRQIAKHGVGTVETRWVRKDGTLISVLLSSAPADPSDLAGNVTFTAQDITGRVRLESELRQAQRLEAIGRLAGGVAHDFNNMLGVIIGHAELALEEADPSGPLREDLEQVLGAARRSADLTRQLLAFARRQTVAPVALDLNEAVVEAAAMLTRLLGEEVELRWEPGSPLWPVMMDPSQLDQILANLLVNAREAIEGPGVVTLETANEVLDQAFCATHAGARAGDYVRLTVSDTGVGMGAEVLAHVFEPFFTTKGQGTGLGLATVYGAVKQNDGYIDVHSEPGRGTTVAIYLPRAESWTAGDVAEVGPHGLAHGSETVLVVEDEESILSVCRTILERQGHTVLTAKSANAALALAEQHAGSIDLLVTDVVLPEMDGRQVRDLLRARRPEMACLFMSGYTADVIGPRGVLDEGVEFLPKPFTVQGLIDKVRSVLDGR